MHIMGKIMLRLRETKSFSINNFYPMDIDYVASIIQRLKIKSGVCSTPLFKVFSTLDSTETSENNWLL